jgi:exosortase B
MSLMNTLAVDPADAPPNPTPASAPLTHAAAASPLQRHWPLAGGLLLLAVPTLVRMWGTVWNEEAYEYGAMMFMIACWLLWRHRDVLAAVVAGVQADGSRREPQPAAVSGLVLLVLGGLMYYIGRSQNMALFEMGALLPLVIGSLMLLAGWAAVRSQWFALLFLAFAVPLPGFIIVAMTGRLKDVVSLVASWVLYEAGYPIARDGVMITIGQYPMLVADACSGMHSLFSLTAMGLLYMHLTYTPDRLRNGLVLAAIIPMAIVANIVRVMVLMLLTYHYGYEAGQGYLHSASGVVLFVVALTGLVAFDSLLRRLRPGAVQPGASA